MTHGFCPTFHKQQKQCTPSNASHLYACSAEFADNLLDRQHRYSCDPSWAAGVYTLTALWNGRARNCESPHDESSPYYVEAAFGIDAQVFSGIKAQRLQDPPEDSAVLAEWGLTWDTHLWAVLDYDAGDDVTVTVTTSDNKTMADVMSLALWCGALLVVVFTALTVCKLFTDAVTQFKLEMLVRDSIARPLVSNLVRCLDFDQDASGSITEKELSLASKKKTKLRKVITNAWICKAETFLLNCFEARVAKLRSAPTEPRSVDIFLKDS
eukprot:COSAG01_NODE_10223_length_2217_cov_1.474032_1_plen_267_part_10